MSDSICSHRIVPLTSLYGSHPAGGLLGSGSVDPAEGGGSVEGAVAAVAFGVGAAVAVDGVL